MPAIALARKDGERTNLTIPQKESGSHSIDAICRLAVAAAKWKVENVYRHPERNAASRVFHNSKTSK
jgi:hypothetical protein